MAQNHGLSLEKLVRSLEGYAGLLRRLGRIEESAAIESRAASIRAEYLES